jgi:RNA recognition motif-containing protein
VRATRRDALSQATCLEATCFVGRLPRRLDLAEVHSHFAGVGAVKQVIPSRDTYLFIEYEQPDAAAAAVRALNGAVVGGSRIVVQPAALLHKLFVGNIPRDVDARQLHAALGAIGEVSCAQGRGSGSRRLRGQSSLCS